MQPSFATLQPAVSSSVDPMCVIIMGDDEAALNRLWREKRGEAEPPDYSDNLLVQLEVPPSPSTGAVSSEGARSSGMST
jgi:hypothetical protein